MYKNHTAHEQSGLKKLKNDLSGRISADVQQPCWACARLAKKVIRSTNFLQMLNNHTVHAQTLWGKILKFIRVHWSSCITSIARTYWKRE
jgi:hypothetical protein